MGIAVASTVVLTRGLVENNLLETAEGRAAVGWLVVEDLFTVLVLVLIPLLANVLQGQVEVKQILAALGWATLKLAALGASLLVIGSRLIPWILRQVARTRSRELFTLSVLAIALAIATGSDYFFGASLALGAFLAGMIVGHSELSHQAAADALPMRDAFSVLFFISVGCCSTRTSWSRAMAGAGTPAIILRPSRRRRW
jgi:CPA2 family monovalent cation:H+ antiporter-2